LTRLLTATADRTREHCKAATFGTDRRDKHWVLQRFRKFPQSSGFIQSFHSRCVPKMLSMQENLWKSSSPSTKSMSQLLKVLSGHEHIPFIVSDEHVSEDVPYGSTASLCLPHNSNAGYVHHTSTLLALAVVLGSLVLKESCNSSSYSVLHPPHGSPDTPDGISPFSDVKDVAPPASPHPHLILLLAIGTLLIEKEISGETQICI